MTNITLSDCEKIIRKELGSERFVVNDFKLTKRGEFLGFLGEYYQLDITVNVDEKLQSFPYFVKASPITNQSHRESQDEQGFQKKEISMYSQIFPKIAGVRIGEDRFCPNFYLSKDDILVLEDLTFKGYKTLPFQFKFKNAHIEESLKALARFHSCSIAYDHNYPGSNIGKEFKDILTINGFVITNPWFHNSLRAIEFVATTKSKHAKSHKELFTSSLNAKMLELLDRMYQPTVHVIKVIGHSDMWKNNLMFNFDSDNFDQPKHCVLLDFQIAKYLPLPIDVLMLILLNTRRAHHEEMMEKYLKFYYESLESALKNVDIDLEPKLSFVKFRASCGYFKLVALVYNAISVMVTHIPTSFFTQITPDEYEAFTLTNRNTFVAQFIDEDPFYKDCVTEAVDELVEYIYGIQ